MPTKVQDSKYILEINGEDSTYKVDSYEFPTTCSRKGDVAICRDLKYGTIILNTDTGNGGVSDLLGTISDGELRGYTPHVAALQCTRF